MNVLFVCRHNRFRSKVAEALFKKYAGPMHSAKSAGIKLDPFFPYVAQAVKGVLRTYGVLSVVDEPALVSDNLFAWAEKIIVVANNVDRSLFPSDKTDVWPIADCDQDDVSGIRLRIHDIDRRVRELLRVFNR